METLLSKYFKVTGFKRLSEVEVAPDASNQHEFNGFSEFHTLFGNEKRVFKGHFILLNDDPDSVIEDNGTLTWYDARESHPTRTEYIRF